MPRYKLVNGERIQLTAEEETARDAEEKAWNDASATRKLAQIKEIGGDETKWNEYKTKYNKVRTDNPKESS